MKEMIFSSPFFSIALCTLTYCFGVFVQKKTKSLFANPLLIAQILVIGFVVIFKVPVEDFNKGGDFIKMFLTPATAVLAVSIYRNFNVLKKNLLPVIIGSAVGSATCMGTVYGLCKLFKVDEIVQKSLVHKSVTMPIATALCEQIGGVPSLIVPAVVITGVVGAVGAPFFAKIFKINNPVATGVAIGTCSHAAGTSRAVEMGETEGAMSSVAIGTAGVMTALFTLLIF